MSDFADRLFPDQAQSFAQQPAKSLLGNGSAPRIAAPSADPAARLFPDQVSEPTRTAGSRFIHDGKTAYRDIRSGARAPARQQATTDYAEQEAQLGAHQYGASHDVEGNPIAPLDTIGAGTPEYVKQARVDRGDGMFAGENDTGENRLAIDAAIDQITPDVPTTLRQAATAEYVAIAGDMGLLPAETLAIAKAAQDAGNADADTIRRWRYTSDNLAKTYGSRQAAVLAEAQRMIRSDPRVATMLTRTGLGNHPGVVKQVLAAADRRLRGR